MSTRPISLDWHKNKVGKPLPCRYGCGKEAICRDESGRAAHKVCAEQALQENTDAAVAAYLTTTIGGT